MCRGLFDFSHSSVIAVVHIQVVIRVQVAIRQVVAAHCHPAAALHQAVSSVCQASEKPQIRIQVEVSRKGRLVRNVLLRHPSVGKKMKIINLMHWQRPLHWRRPQMKLK